MVAEADAGLDALARGDPYTPALFVLAALRSWSRASAAAVRRLWDGATDDGRAALCSAVAAAEEWKAGRGEAVPQILTWPPGEAAPDGVALDDARPTAARRRPSADPEHEAAWAVRVLLPQSIVARGEGEPGWAAALAELKAAIATLRALPAARRAAILAHVFPALRGFRWAPGAEAAVLEAMGEVPPSADPLRGEDIPMLRRAWGLSPTTAEEGVPAVRVRWVRPDALPVPSPAPSGVEAEDAGRGRAGPADDVPTPPPPIASTVEEDGAGVLPGPAAGDAPTGGAATTDPRPPYRVGAEDGREDAPSVPMGATPASALPDAAPEVAASILREPAPMPCVSAAPSPPDAVLVTDGAEFCRVLAATESSPVVGLDTETTGLDPHSDRVRTIQIATGDAAWVVDAWAVGDSIGLLRDWLAARARAGHRTVLHNAKFDLSMLRAALGGAPLDPVAVCDPMLWSQLLACGLPVEGGHGLAAVARRWIGVDLPKEEQSGAWDKALRPEQVVYAGRDAWVLVPLAEALWNGAGGHRGIADEGLARVAALEDACVPAVADLEYDGIAFDLPYWAGLTEEMRAEAVSARAEALAGLAPGLPRRAARISMFGEVEGPALNPDSPAQVLEALRGLGLEVAGTAEDVLKPLAGAHRAVAALLRYKRTSKLLSAFGEALPRHVHPVTRRIYSRFQQICPNGVGRFSASAPNLQQCPHDARFRRAFVAPEGRRLIIADYSMVELRLAAEIAGDRRMLDIFNRRAAATGEEERVRWDLHRQTAALMLGKDAGEVTKAERALGKPTNFGLIYSLGAAGLADYARNGYGVEMTLEEATAYKARFFEAYRGIAAWHRRERARIEAAIRAGDWAAVCARTITGRRRQFPWRAFEEVRIGEVYNTPVQGAGADLLKRAMARIRPYAVRGGWALVNTIHDELVFEVPVEDAEAAAARVKSEMEAAGGDLGLKVPIEVEAGVGQTWADKA